MGADLFLDPSGPSCYQGAVVGLSRALHYYMDRLAPRSLPLGTVEARETFGPFLSMRGTTASDPKQLV